MRSQTTTRLSQGCFQKSTVRIKTESGWTAAFLLDGRTLRSVLLAPSIRGVFCVSVYIKTRYVEAYKSKHFEDMKKLRILVIYGVGNFVGESCSTETFGKILNVVNIGAFPMKLLCIKTILMLTFSQYYFYELYLFHNIYSYLKYLCTKTVLQI